MPHPRRLVFAAIAAITLALAITATTRADEPTPVAVDSPDALQTAIKAAAAADAPTVIDLAPGDYGQLHLKNKHFKQPVTLRAADRAQPPTFGFIRLAGASNLTFDGLVLTKGHTVPTSQYFALVDVGPAKNITFLHCRFVGSKIEEGPAAGYGNGYAIKTRSTIENLTVRRCVLTNLSKAIATAAVESLTIEQNVFHDYRSDAMFIAGKNIRIEDNLILDPKPFTLPKGQGDHPDFIQGYSLADVVIRDNFFRGGHSQGVFVHAAMKNKPVPENIGRVHVLNNIIYTHMRNALMVTGLPDSRVAHNLVLEHSQKMDYTVAHVTVTGQDSIVAHNIAESVTEQSAEGDKVTYRMNIDLQRDQPEGPKSYAKYFVNALSDENATIQDFQLKPDAVQADPQPGIDFTQYAWLSELKHLDNPEHEAYPLWLQLDEVGRQKVLHAIGRGSK